MEVARYPEAATLDTHLTTPQATVSLLDTTKPLLVHMEILRRAYATLGQNPADRQMVLKLLKDRYMAKPTLAERYFDYGYAQLVMDGNKNGLFFLRKANDTLASPFTSLAYAIAQIDVDRDIEHATPDALTTRKMDAVYKLKDALMFNREDRLPGVWPSYVHVLQALADYPAFSSLQTEDVTTLLVPVGNLSLNRQSTGVSEGSAFLAMLNQPADPPKTSASEPLPPDIASCTCSGSSAVTTRSRLAYSKSFDLNNDTTLESVNFYTGAAAQSPYQVEVYSHDSRLVGQFASYKAPYIIEDLEGDGKYELVVRQFDKDLYHPLYVYRWNGQCYGEDQRISAYFH
jgi:hypothetical protein